MAKVQYEEFLPRFGIDGDISFWSEEKPLMGAPLILKVGQKYAVKFEWTQLGNLCHVLNGNWVCQVYFEQMGPGEEFVQPIKKVPFVRKPGYKYSVELELPVADVGPGVYRAVAEILFEDPKGRPMPIAAFADLGWLHVYR